MKVSNYRPSSFRLKGTKPNRLVPNKSKLDGSGVVDEGSARLLSANALGVPPGKESLRSSVIAATLSRP
jgi:hypothetical protein